MRGLWRGENNPSLAASLGNAYAIAPDVVVSRAPVSDEEINAHRLLVDDTVATHAALRASVQLGAVAPVGMRSFWSRSRFGFGRRGCRRHGR